MAIGSLFRSAIAEASALLSRQQWLRRALKKALAVAAPGTLERIKAVARRGESAMALNTAWKPADAELHALSQLHPALADPQLRRLERPAQSSVEYLRKLTTSSAEAFEPVVELSQMRQSATTICFVVPVSGLDRDALDRTLQSILRQTDPGWEALLCCDADDTTVAPLLEGDWRVRRFVRTMPFSSEASDLAAAVIQATTHFIGLLSAGDVVDDDLVKAVGERLRAEPNADLVYTDETRFRADGSAGEPFYKPDWSPEYQHSVNMLGRFVAIRKSLLLQARVRSGLHPNAIEYGLLLDMARRARVIAHIDDPLYIRDGSSPARFGGFFEPAALDDARAVLQETLAGDGDGEVDGRQPQVRMDQAHGSLHVRWYRPLDMPVTLLILTGMHQRELPGHGKVTLATHFVRSIITNTRADDYRIIVVDDGAIDEELRKLLADHGHSSATCPRSEPFSFAQKANFASSLVESGIVLLLNDDLEVLTPDWIEELAGQASRPEVGAVGCRLLFGDGTIQHAGIVMGLGSTSGHVFHAASADGSEYAGMASIDRNWSAVTGAVMAYRKEVFDEVGGFDPVLRTDYNDIDFCLKCAAAGYRVVYTPAATLFHFHNSSLKRKHDSTPERDAFVRRWSHVVRRDPYFNKNFNSQSAEELLVAAL